MLGLIVHWDHKPKMNHDWLRHTFQMFDYVARAYNVDKMVFVDELGTLQLLAPTYQVVETTQEALDVFPSTPAFALLPNYGHNLFEFSHPEDAVYVVGPDYNNFVISGVTALTIPMANPHMELWASQVVSIVLAHRFAYDR